MSVAEKLELKAPPVVVWLVTAFLMKLSTPVGHRIAWLRQPNLALALALGGVLLGVLGVVSFHRAHTTVDPRHPQKMTALVTSGVYRTTRNPMYLGMLLTLAGWALWLGQLLPFIFLPFFVLFLNRWQIAPEERALERTFGAEYTFYRARARRWI
jgi:protein-S-isoprenylcysteine O-methyltransferase Ste14